jgi:type IV pilus assembly protein PilQ
MTQMPLMHIARPAAKLVVMGALALAGAVALSAGGAAPIRLLGVTGQGGAVVIEASEPVAYTVSRPDPLTVLVDLRNVSVADAANQVERRDPITRVTLEQASAVDGKALARVRLQLARPFEAKVRSLRNTIRVELTPSTGASAAPALPAPLVRDDLTVAPATVLERIRASRAAAATTVTLAGNGRLTPATITESQDQPRRLVIDFPDVSSKAPANTIGDGTLVKAVRVGVNSRQPLVTRVVMEVAPAATYHVERAGSDGRDLAVVFEGPQASATVMLSPSLANAPAPPEPDIPLQEAIANAAALIPQPPAEAPAPAAKPLPRPPQRQDPPATPPRPNTPAQTPPPAAPPAAEAVVPAPAPQPPAPVTPAPAPGVAATQQISANQEKKYNGAPVSLDFSGADLRTVLRYFSNISGLNIIIDPSVPATPVDILLTDVPWDQAFETILRGNKLGYVAEGTIIRIAPVSVLSDEEADRRKLSEAKALSGDLRVQTFSLSYAKAADMQPLLVKSALSQRGQIQVDTRTNTLIITDLPDRLQTAANLIGALDRPEPQVEVEARVVQTTRDFAKAIGVQWGFNGRVSPALGNTTPLTFPNSGSLGGRTGGVQQPNDVRATENEQTATAVNLAVPGASSAIGLALGSVNGAFNLDVALTALERSGKGRVLSTPRLTTQNNVLAEVAQGIQIPIQTVANNTVTVTFKEAVLLLKVTPQITSANTVIMQITIENANADFSRQVNGIPPIDTQRAMTQVQVNDGATTIIGGIFVSREQTSNERTPGLHRIPLIGWLFKKDTTSDESRELLIFITPRILKG